MIDPKAVEELRTQIADAEEHDDPAVSITFGCARALLTASQARHDVVEEMYRALKAVMRMRVVCPEDIESEVGQCREAIQAYERSLKTGERDAG